MRPWESELLERLLKKPPRLFGGDVEGLKAFAACGRSRRSVLDALEPASDLSDRRPVKTAARRRMARLCRASREQERDLVGANYKLKEGRVEGISVEKSRRVKEERGLSGKWVRWTEAWILEGVLGRDAAVCRGLQVRSDAVGTERMTGRCKPARGGQRSQELGRSMARPRKRWSFCFSVFGPAARGPYPGLIGPDRELVSTK